MVFFEVEGKLGESRVGMEIEREEEGWSRSSGMGWE